MSNLRKWIEGFELAMGERVEAVAVGRRREWDDLEPQEPVDPIDRDEALAMFDYEFRASMGSQDQPHAFYAWTESWVLLLTGEEGGTGLVRVPRGPHSCVPAINGTDAYS